MAKQIPSYLKLLSDDSATTPPAAVESIPIVEQFTTAFAVATGWRLDPHLIPLSAASNMGEQEGAEPLLRWQLEPASEVEPQAVPVELHKARQLAEAFRLLTDELQQSRTELWRREAELAAGVPVTSLPDDEQHLAERLEAVLKGGTESVGADAAALYLLDDATTQLNMRACWGMSRNKLLLPARSLRGAVADLEALVGHAVVIEDTSLLPHWRVPEPYNSAVCVPVASPTEPFGTLWIFDEESRPFNDHQTNLVEIIAGRIASELQREALLQDCRQSKDLDDELVRAARWQHDRLPNIKPLLDNWQLAGATAADESLGRGFYDWFVPRDGSIAVAVGTAEGRMIESALTMASLQSLLRAHTLQETDPKKVVAGVNESYWNSSAGGQFASLCFARLDPEGGDAACVLVGDVEAWVVGQDRIEPIAGHPMPLGTDPEVSPAAWQGRLDAGESLVAFARGRVPTGDSSDGPPNYLSTLVDRLDDSAEQRLSRLAAALDQEAGDDWTALLVQRG